MTGISRADFPIRLTEKARELGAQGRLFNTVKWGGYLTWTLGRQVQPYIDGRYLMNTSRLDDYTHILWATDRGRRLFEESRFDWVLVPYRNSFAVNGPNYPIIELLRNHPLWELRMADDQGVLFSRRPPRL